MIRTLLIANRGEIACRIARTARAMGIRTVGVYAPADRLSLHVQAMDDAWVLEGATAAETYLDLDAIVQVAVSSGADAVHPGYGFLSERSDAATAVIAAGLRWVGPRPESIAAMGNKVEAKAAMVAAGLPVLPGERLTPNAAATLATGARVGYPLLVKAESGGGGRGMRLVERPDELVAAAIAAAREAEASFGDPRVFAERFLRSPRHVEVQVFGDEHGAVVHLGARDCSVQRRHQKLLEESPPPGLDADLLAAMTSASVAAARGLGYVGAGTFEFLVEDGEFFFLEMNTRLQVEHPVTELVTGIDLVRWQLLVAAGGSLPCAQEDIVSTGHAVEARICAEDPVEGWMPSTGTIHRWEPGRTPVRWDVGVETGSQVLPAFDSMVGKVIAHAATREEATAALARALDELVVHGVFTNAGFLARVLTSGDFGEGRLSIDLLDRHPELRVAGPGDEVHALIASLAATVTRRSRAGALPFAPAGWRNVGAGDRTARWSSRGEEIGVRHRFDGTSFEAELDGRRASGRFALEGDGAAVLELGGRVHRAVVTQVVSGPSGDETWVHTFGRSSLLTAVPRHPAGDGAGTGGGSVVAPVPGTVVAVLVQPGELVAEGDRLVVIEAMKMEHAIVAQTAGSIIEVLVRVGDAIEAHAPVAVLGAVGPAGVE